MHGLLLPPELSFPPAIHYMSSTSLFFIDVIIIETTLWLKESSKLYVPLSSRNYSSHEMRVRVFSFLQLILTNLKNRNFCLGRNHDRTHNNSMKACCFATNNVSWTVIEKDLKMNKMSFN